MTPEQHARAKELFLAACEQPAAGRARFLDDACGTDHELRNHVEKLLEHHTERDRAATRTSGALALNAPANVGHDSAARATQRRFEPGTLIADRYRIVSLLGKGGMGQVYRADDTMLAQPVALKFLAERFGRDTEWLARFVSEARVAREITHPNICRVHDVHVDRTAGEVFISMEYVDGEDLRSLLRRVGRLSLDKALAVAREICVGLAAAHAKGILHRDLKPANVMLDGAGHVRIMDFGLAAPREAISEREIRSGTPGYMAPELFAGTDVSVQSDIYALGLVLYELFTGRRAFEADSFTAFGRLHQRSRPTPPSACVPDLPPAIDRLIQQCLEKDPGARPQSAVAVAAALPGTDPLAVALSAGVTASPTVVAAAGTKAALSLKAATGLLAAVFVALLLVVLLAGRSGLTPDFRATKPASVLAERARQLVGELGFSETVCDQAYGYTFWPADNFFGPRRSSRAGEIAFASQGTSAPKFWYRQSTTSLAPVTPVNITFGRARTTLTDPPRAEPGMVALVLDHHARLLGFETAPRHSADRPSTPVDWTPFFTAAELNPDDLAATTPILEPAFPVDEHLAWESRASDQAPERIRVEATAIQGQPTRFAVLRGGAPLPATSRNLDRSWRSAVVNQTRIALLTVAALGAIPLAWQNIRRSRGDRRGALCLAGAAVVGRLAVWALSASHTDQFDAELRLLLFALLRAWFEAGLVWAFYIAFEPHVRRFWPQTMVAWSRLIAGRTRDALVARDMLVGTLLGLCIVLLFQLDRLALHWLGWEAREPLRMSYALEPLLGVWYGAATCINLLLATLYLALFLVTFLTVARVILRRTWLAGLVTVAAIMPVYLPGRANPALSWLPLLIVLAALIWAAARVGLVVLLSAILVARLLLELPLSFDAEAVGWDVGVFVLIVICAMAIYAFTCGRRPSLAPGLQPP